MILIFPLINIGCLSNQLGFLQSFNNVLQLLEYEFCTHFVKFISMYLILFHTIVNGFILFISFLDNLLQVYKNAIDICILILYLETLLNSFICCDNFLTGCFGIFLLTRLSSANKKQFYFFLSSLDALYFIFLPNCSDQNYSTMLNRSGKRKFLCLLRGKESILSPLHVLLMVNFLSMPFIRLRQYPSIPVYLMF